jgi:hypothetical protein
MFDSLAMAGNSLVEETSALTALFWSGAAAAIFLVIQFAGARYYAFSQSRNPHTPITFLVILSALGIAGTVIFSFIPDADLQLFLGMTCGALIWTALGEIPEQSGWYSHSSRRSLLVFLCFFAVWLAIAFIFTRVPLAVLGCVAYIAWVWGLHQARTRVIAKWGPVSLATTLLIILLGMMAGGAVVIGAFLGTPFSGTSAGLAFAITIWSLLEVIWEQEMAQGPWHQKNQKTM